MRHLDLRAITKLRNNERSNKYTILFKMYILEIYFSVQILLTQSRIKPYHATGLFLNPHKISENLCVSGVFRGYRKTPVA